MVTTDLSTLNSDSDAAERVLIGLVEGPSANRDATGLERRPWDRGAIAAPRPAAPAARGTAVPVAAERTSRCAAAATSFADVAAHGDAPAFTSPNPTDGVTLIFALCPPV